jgi:hypothetical protein
MSADDAAFLDDDANLDEMFASLMDEAADTIPQAKATSSPKPEPKPKPATGAGAGAATGAATGAGARSRSREPAKAPARPRQTPGARGAPAKPARPAAKPAARKAAPLPGGVSEKDARALYDRYVQAKKLVGDSVENLSYDKIVKTISTQAPRIMKQYGAKGVEFNVVLKDDKVILKAKPKK